MLYLLCHINEITRSILESFKVEKPGKIKTE